jgi:hypothetical protein
VVDNLDNGSQVASEGVVAVDHDDSANLNEAPVGTLNNSVAHCAGDLTEVGQSQVPELARSACSKQLRSWVIGAFIPVDMLSR